MRIAVVVSRYHSDISGGAEKEAFHYASLLSREHEVTVLTTTALDYITWENILEPGLKDGNPSIFRFDSNRKRNQSDFNKFCFRIFKKQTITADEEEEFLLRQGPMNTDLVSYIEKNATSYDCFILFSYLYYPIVKSLPFIRTKAILVPTLHDEKPAYLNIYKNVLDNKIVYAFNTPEELLLFTRIYGFRPDRYEIIGMDVEEFPETQAKDSYENYFVAIGRIDEGKGYSLLAEYFDKWNRTKENKYTLVLAGKSSVRFHGKSNIVITGFVKEEEKNSLLTGALALINPSPLESFSIVIMESWLKKKAVIVNGKSEVMVGHCERSNGGLWYTDYESFCAVLNYFVTHPDSIEKMGLNGWKYVRKNYNTGIIQSKLNKLLKYFQKNTKSLS